MTTAAEPAWKMTPEKVQAVVERLIQVGKPKKIILFGSYVRGDATRNSDLDVLVVTSDAVESPRRESVRLRNSVSDINMPIDILVVPYSRFEALREKLGLIYREADRRGKVVYESCRGKILFDLESPQSRYGSRSAGDGAQSNEQSHTVGCCWVPAMSPLKSILRDKGQPPRVYSVTRCVKSDQSEDGTAQWRSSCGQAAFSLVCTPSRWLS
jgi:predicted nucleotidyltransferase